MTTIDTILQLLNEDTHIATVLYESPYSANLKIDRKPSPYAIVYLVQSMDIDVRGSRYFRTLDLEVFFCKPTDLSADGATIQAVCDQMMPMVEDFLHRLQDTRLFEFDSVKCRQAVGRFDKNVSGLVLELTISERKPVCFTELPEPTPEPTPDTPTEIAETDTLSDLT